TVTTATTSCSELCNASNDATANSGVPIKTMRNFLMPNRNSVKPLDGWSLLSGNTFLVLTMKDSFEAHEFLHHNYHLALQVTVYLWNQIWLVSNHLALPMKPEQMHCGSLATRWF